MKLTLQDELPFTTVKASYQGKVIEIPNTLIDTGSATTILSADVLSTLNIFPSP